MHRSRLCKSARQRKEPSASFFQNVTVYSSIRVTLEDLVHFQSFDMHIRTGCLDVQAGAAEPPPYRRAEANSPDHLAYSMEYWVNFCTSAGTIA